MSNLLVEIFSYLMEKDVDALEMQNKVNLEMERMLVPYKDDLSEEEKEKMYDFLYDLVYVAEREAILYGIKFMIKLFLKL